MKIEHYVREKIKSADRQTIEQMLITFACVLDRLDVKNPQALIEVLESEYGQSG